MDEFLGVFVIVEEMQRFNMHRKADQAGLV